MVERSHGVRSRIEKALSLFSTGAIIGAMVGALEGFIAGDNTMIFISGFLVGPAAGFALVVSETIAQVKMPRSQPQ